MGLLGGIAGLGRAHEHPAPPQVSSACNRVLAAGRPHFGVLSNVRSVRHRRGTVAGLAGPPQVAAGYSRVVTPKLGLG